MTAAIINVSLDEITRASDSVVEDRATLASQGSGAGFATVSTSAVASAQTTVAANVATLVADGATPTQAHVTTLNTNWGTLNTALNTLESSVATQNAVIAGDVQVQINSNVTTANQLKACLRLALQTAIANGTVTA